MIGEAAAHVADATRALAPEVPWRQVVGFRDFVVHVYFAVNMDIIWTTARPDVPAIASAVLLLVRGHPPAP